MDEESEVYDLTQEILSDPLLANSVRFIPVNLEVEEIIADDDGYEKKHVVYVPSLDKYYEYFINWDFRLQQTSLIPGSVQEVYLVMRLMKCYEPNDY